MDQILRIVEHTPLWAFALFAVLVMFGLQALKPRTLPIWRLLIVPAVFVSWGAISLATRSAAFPILILDWAITAAIGFGAAWLTTRLDGVQFDHARGLVQMPGSALPLIRNLLIFAAKYGLTAAMTVAPALQSALLPWDIGVSGLSAGYFLGWLFCFAVLYRGIRKSRPLSSPVQ